jgi:hypothetical protein
LGILTQESKVLPKSGGRYCPFDDVWGLSPDVV